MNNVLLSIIIILSIASCNNHRNKYLNSKYAFDKQYELEKTKSKIIPLSDKLTDEGLTFYKQKNDQKAIERYEKALDIYPSAQIYYYYGNSLSNIGENENAIKAYKVAIELEFKNSELALYNIACSYSKLKKYDDSIEYLKDSIIYGYPSFQNILNDPDLKSLRNDYKWKNSYDQLFQLYNKGNSEFLVGKKIKFGVASTIDIFIFCENGNIMVNHCTSEHRRHYKIGKWNIKNYKININLNQEFGEKGVGNPIICGSVCSYSKYEAFEKNINEKKVLFWHEVEKDQYGHWKVAEHKEECKSGEHDFIKICQ